MGLTWPLLRGHILLKANLIEHSEVIAVVLTFILFFFIHHSGAKGTTTRFFPVTLTCFKNSTTSWVEFSGGQHHTVCRDAEGN